VTANATTADDVLAAATRVSGLKSTGAEIIRDGSNVMYRLPGNVVARIGRPGSLDTAKREVQVSQWLTDAGLAVVQALNGVLQPVVVNARPVTWWMLLPEHRPANPAELGGVLRKLHALSKPGHLHLPELDPFRSLDHRINATTGLGQGDRAWLLDRLAVLRTRHHDLPLDDRRDVIHGDAWQGNVAVPESGAPILLDLENVSLGRHEWDLVPIAVDYTDFARLTDTDYQSFVDAYGGYDLTTTPSYRTLADIQELRWVCFVLSKSGTSTAAAEETRHRIACLRGDIPRPWSWKAF
jgi:hypothetical protein